MLQYVENKNIDLKKWDNLVSKSANGFIYSTSKYLNLVSENWDAFIFDDYKIIMPLPFKKKYGVKYIMQPLFAQQLGIIYEEKPKQAVIDLFITQLKNKFKYFALNLNYDNNISVKLKNTDKTNLILNLNKPYKQLFSEFTTNTKRNINKSKKENFSIRIEKTESNSFIDFFVSNLTSKEPKSTIQTLKEIIDSSFINNIGEIIYINNSTENIAAVFILKSYNRYIYLAATSNKEGKNRRAMFYLVNYFINKNSETECFLDFEGSDIDGVKRFYNGFNAVEQNYKQILKKIF